MEDFRVENAQLSEAAAAYLDPQTPKNLKLLIARGTVPLPPRELVVLQYHFQKDPDPEVAEESRRGLTGIPEDILRTILGSNIHPEILGFFSLRLLGNRELMETLILNKMTADETVAQLAARENDEYLLEMIASNQERVIRYPAIAKGIFQNNSVPRMIKERLRGFLRTTFPGQGKEVIPEESPPTQPDREPAAPPEQEPEQVETIMLDQQAPVAPPVEDEAPAPMVEVEGEWDDMIELTDEIGAIKLPNELLEEGRRELSEDERKSLSVEILQMTVSEKIKLALLGNKEARTILVRDSNKMVSSAVIKSPKIQEDEVVKIAQMRNVSDDVLRIISQNKDWTKTYAVKRALVENPKTPVSASFRFLSMLRESDIKSIARSKNVPSAVSAQARRLTQQKQQAQKRG